MHVLTFSRFFPKGHPKAGKETFFVEQILNSIYPGGKANTLRVLKPEVSAIVNDFFVLDGSRQKHHTIRAGNRFKPGDMASLRVWSDKPYRSKQIEFAQVEVKKVFGFAIIDQHVFVRDWNIGPFHQDLKLLQVIVANDGLEIEDFVSWFAIHPKKKEQTFEGQIIAWNPDINY